GFIGCTNYPECRYTRQLAPGNGANGGPDGGMKKLGEDPVSGLEVTLRSGRFGPYIQLGEATEGEKPKRASLPKGLSAADVALQPPRPTATARAGCFRCRARSASIPTMASRSSPASVASGPTCNTARPTPISPQATTCSPSGSTAP